MTDSSMIDTSVSSVYDQTLQRPLTLTGVGLHSGQQATLTLRPRATSGRVLHRVGQSPVSLCVSEVTQTRRCTEVAGAMTVEHVLAALYALGYTAVDLELWGPEFPILDGSALPVVQALQQQHPRSLGSRRKICRVPEAFSLNVGDCEIRVRPAETLCIDYVLEYPLSDKDSPDKDASGNNVLRFSRHYAGHSVFEEQIAPARTFVFERDITHLRAAGQAQGGSLDNAVVFDDAGQPLNVLRFEDEPVRHKILDLLGDLALLGAEVQAHIQVWRGGHTAHVKLVQQLEKYVR